MRANTRGQETGSSSKASPARVPDRAKFSSVINFIDSYIPAELTSVNEIGNSTH